MNKKAVFFDLDGTLVRMELSVMFDDYFKRLEKSGALCCLDPDPKKAMEIFRDASMHMMKNNGGKNNDIVFCERIEEICGVKRSVFEPRMQHFYENEFDEIKALAEPPSLQNEIIKTLKNKGYYLGVATYPAFPAVAAKKRLAWAGVDHNDFSYITDYTKLSYNKPSLEYYKSILEQTGFCAEQCIMIGNDYKQDICARKLGFDVFFLTGYEIGENTEGVPSGDLEDLLEYAKKLPDINGE